MTRILVADDAPDIVQFLQDALTAEGYDVVPAYDGVEAVQKYRETTPNLVLLDVMMPRMDGYEACRRIKELAKEQFIPVVIITAREGAREKVIALDAGADEFLTKPVDVVDVLTRVRSLLRTAELYENLQRSYEELRRVEKLRDELIGMIVHDLRSPLAVIQGTLQLIEGELADRLDEEMQQALSAALAATRRQSNLIRNLLDVQRMEEGKMPLSPVRFSLPRAIETAVNEVAVIARRRGVNVVTAMPSNLPQVRADETLVLRIVDNLLENALRHTPPEGTVRVSAESRPGWIVVRVADSGTGIPDEYRAAIFEKFEQVEAKRASARVGVGLGLAFCRLAVEAHGGRIWVESQPPPHKGSIFSFTLPAADSPSPNGEEPKE